MTANSSNFADRLLEAVREKKNPSCVGLDPRIELMPEQLKETSLRRYGNTLEAAANTIVEFNTMIIKAVADVVPAVKPQIAFYEQYGSAGIRAFEETVRYAKSQGLVVIEDAKRNDIGSTARAYADGHLGEVNLFRDSEARIFDVDAMTVNPYLGVDGIQPFIDSCKKYHKGIFVLARTSNPSARDLQDRTVESEGRTIKMYIVVAMLIDEWGKELKGEKGYSSVGAVVGATYPKEARELRAVMHNSIFLVPGYGAQGARAEDVVHTFNEDGQGSIVNSSRGIIFAYRNEPYRTQYSSAKFRDAARAAALDMKREITEALARAEKLNW